MKFRDTLILLAILAALAAYVLLVERKQPSPEDGASSELATALPQILSCDTEDVRMLRLVRPSTGQHTDLAYKDDGLWYISAPIEEEADQSKVVSLAASLANLCPQRVLTATVGQPADYDLDPPAMQVTIETRDGLVSTLSLGAPNPSRSGYYGQLSGDDRIYLLPFHLGVDVERYLNQPPVKPTPVPTSAATKPPTIPPIPPTQPAD